MQMPVEKTPDIYEGVSGKTIEKIQMKRRRLKLENQMSTAKRQKEAHEFKKMIDEQEKHKSLKEQRRAHRSLASIGRAYM